MVVEKIKNFLWPNRGMWGAFLVWAVFVMINVVTSPLIDLGWDVLLAIVAINLVIIYLITCVSIWAYEKLKKKKR